MHRDYWKRVFARAYSDTVRLLGSNPWRTLLVVLFTIVGAVVWGFFEGSVEGLKKFLWAFLGVAVAATAGILVFIVRFVMTPPILEKEAKEASDVSLAQMTENYNNMVVANQGLEETLLRLQQSREEREAELVNQIELVRRQDPKKNALIRDIKRRISIFEGVVTLCDARNPAAVEKFFGIDHQTNVYIQQHHPEYTGYVGSYPVQNTYTNMASYPERTFNELKAVAVFRIERLKEILHDMGE